MRIWENCRFHGAVVHPNGGRVPVSTENLLLRQCLLKNTDFVEGIVIYAGHETKAMLNHGGPRYKVTNVTSFFFFFFLNENITKPTNKVLYKIVLYKIYNKEERDIFFSVQDWRNG